MQADPIYLYLKRTPTVQQVIYRLTPYIDAVLWSITIIETLSSDLVDI